MRTSSQSEAPISVIGRVFAIFEAFGPDREEMSLADLSARTGIPKATVHRIATELTSRRLLEKVSGGFRLGMHLFELGALVPHQRSLRDLAMPFMEDLYEATHEVVHLGVLDNNEVLYVAKIAGHRALELPTRIGGRMPVHSTALGKSLLAFAPQETVQRVIAGGLPRLTRHTITVPQVLVEELKHVAHDGVSFEREESVLGNCCVAAPVIVPRQGAVAAVSISGPTTRLDLERLAPAVRMAALSVSRQLGRAPSSASRGRR